MTVENSISVAQSVLPTESGAAAFNPIIRPLRVSHVQLKMKHRVEKLFPSEGPVMWETNTKTSGAVVHTHESVLTHYMLNLVSNACKFTSHGSIHVKLSLVYTGNGNGEPTASSSYVLSCIHM